MEELLILKELLVCGDLPAAMVLAEAIRLIQEESVDEF